MNFRLLTITIAPFACFIIGYIACSYLLDTPTCQTPDLIGLSTHEALLKTSKLQLNLQIIAQKEHEKIPPGTILSQKPTPKRLIKPNQSILITISRTPNALTAINVSTMNQVEIKDWCKKNNIILKTYDIPSELPTGTYLGQYPNPAEIITEKTMIIYYANNNQQLCLMPNFKNKKVSDALTVLNHYQCKIQIFNHNHALIDHYAPNDQIVAQKPIAGSMVDMHNTPIIQLQII